MQGGRASEVTAQFEHALGLFRSNQERLAHQAAWEVLERAPEHVGAMMLLLASAAAIGEDLPISAALNSISGRYGRLLAIPEVREMFDSDLLAPVTTTWTFRTVFAPSLRAVQHGEGVPADRLLARQVQEATRDAAVDAALLRAPAFRKAPPRLVSSTLHLVDQGPRMVIAVIQAGRVHLVGRGDDATIRLEHPSVSRRHLYIQVCDGDWFVQNLSKTNGTRLNGQALGDGWAVVQEGDELRLGDTILDVLAPGHPYAFACPEMPVHTRRKEKTALLPRASPDAFATCPGLEALPTPVPRPS